jgi:hypothetical protein
MDKPEQRFKVNTRVRLRDGVDSVFFGGYSRSGNEGWIRKRKRDRYGFPEVLVEWDKDHWAYNGQPDCWSMEGQFEAVEENDMEAPTPKEARNKMISDLTEKFLGALLAVLDNEEPEATAEQPEAEEENVEEQWDTLAAEAAEVVTKAPAYVVVALERMEVDGAPPMIIPRIFHAAREPDYKLITQSHLAHVLASMQDETIAGVFQSRASDDSED